MISAGYCRDDELVAAYRSMDVLAYPMPGTDKSCRTVREAMAAGVPVIASKIGFLSELIRDGVDGRLVEPASGPMAAAIVELMEDRSGLGRMAEQSVETARERFGRTRQACLTIDMYETLSKKRQSNAS